MVRQRDRDNSSNLNSIQGKEPIDIVIAWVDGSDPKWQSERRKWSAQKGADSSIKWNDSDARYRDWGLLRYWFRGIENYAPWVNKVFFVTNGQVPAWLNRDHPKIRCVRHDEYIPQQYIPTFSSHCIELNLHRIEDLSEHFIYFNDDMFLLRPTRPEDFFRSGMPCDAAIMKPIRMIQNGIRAEINDLYVINDRFSMLNCIRRNPSKWFNLQYGLKQISSLLMLPYGGFSGFFIAHLPIAYNKSVFHEVWDAYGDILDETCRHRFRDVRDVNQWLMQYWQFVTGRFVPRAPGIGRTFEGKKYLDEACEIIRAQKYKMICINDSIDIDDFSAAAEKVRKAFNDILPTSSELERECE